MAIKGLIDAQDSDFTYNKDYLSLANNARVKKQLLKYGETLDDNNFMSESIFVYNQKLKKRRVAIIVTKTTIFVFRGKRFKLIRRSLLEDLDRVSISSKNCTLIALHFIKGYDMMIETYRRVDLILYTAMQMKKSKIPLFKLSYRKMFKLKSKKKISAKLDAKNNVKAALPQLQEVFRNSKKMGFMKLQKIGFFVNSYREYFFILTNLGLVYYKNYGVRLFV